MEILTTHSFFNNYRANVKAKKKDNTMLFPLNTKEKTLIHNGSSKLGLQNNNISSSLNVRKSSFSSKKNILHSSFLNIHQDKNTEIENIKEKENINEKEKENNPKKSIYNILVAIRCRPLSQREKEISQKETIQVMDKKMIKLKDPNGFLNPNNIRSKEQILEFDYVFDNKDSQEIIFNKIAKPLIDGIINGFNATVFAYGATGAGKTYTMLGNDENPGIMPLTFVELFKKIKKYSKREYTIKLCYLEIYNENIKDLLINNSPNLELREDPNKGLIVNGITEIITNSGEHILSILKKGNKNRTTEATNANQTSSRSHAILQIIVSYKEKENDNNIKTIINNNISNNNIKYGKLSLVDLAGSERASVTKNKGIRLIEGANINKSLLTLGNCINALCEYNLKGTKSHIPYRDSKLTRLLKDSLGGNSRTVMIANISPFIYSFDDTYNTLNYADRAKHIKTRVKINIMDDNKSNINNYLNIIKDLQNKVNMLENKLYNKNIDNYLLLKEKEKPNDENNFGRKKIISKSLEKNIERKIKYDNNINNINNMNYINKIMIDKKNIGDIIEQNEKKIDSIIEDYVQLSKAEVQIKQKVMGIKYDIFILNNKIINNKVFFPLSLSSSFTQKGKSEKTKLRSLIKILDKNVLLLSDISQKNENILKKYTENNNNEESIIMNDLQKKYISLINKSSGIQKENIEIKYNNAIIKNDLDKKENYIKELIKQIELRDIIFKNNILETKNLEDEKDIINEIKKLMNQRQKLEYLTLSQLLDKYLLLNNKNYHNCFLNKNSSFTSSNNYTSGYQNKQNSFRPRLGSFINKRDLISKQKNNFDEYLDTDNIIYNESANNSRLNLGINILYSNRRKIQNKNKDDKLFINISKKKDNNLNEYKNQLNIAPMSLNNIEIKNSEIKNKKVILNFNENLNNPSDEDKNINNNNEENNTIEKDITLQSMLNDIKIMNSEIKSKFNKLENNANIKNTNKNNVNNTINQIMNNLKKSKAIENKNNINNKNNKNQINNNKKKSINLNIINKINNLKNIDNKISITEIENKNNIIIKNINPKNKISNNQIYVNKINNIKNNKNHIKNNTITPLIYEIENNKNNSLLKNMDIIEQNNSISSTNHNINYYTVKKSIKIKKTRNNSMTKRNTKTKNKNFLKNILNKQYDSNNNNDNSQNKNLNRSLIMSDEKKIALDSLIDEAKKKLNKQKLKYNHKNVLTNESININNSNQINKKLQKFYEEHLNKIINKNNNNMNNKSNIMDNSYEYNEKNINIIKNHKTFNFKINSKEKIKNYNNKYNNNQLTRNEMKKKDNEK